MVEEGPRAEVIRAEEDLGMEVPGKRTPNHVSPGILAADAELGSFTGRASGAGCTYETVVLTYIYVHYIGNTNISCP